ncbi:MAG: hypothetical protein AAFW68_00765 [Pseudomonadota bacterium]
MNPRVPNDRCRETAFEDLKARVRAVSTAPLSAPAAHVLEALLDKYPGAAALFYGSGVSVSAAEEPSSIMFDFYIIADDYDAVYSASVLKIANKLIPPNVFYFETPSRFGTLRAKYAVLSIKHFEQLVSDATFHSYFWARFAQPTRIHTSDKKMAARLETALATAITTFCVRASGLMGGPFTAKDLWLDGLGASYKAELRAEDKTRSARLIESYGDWTERVTEPALVAAGLSPQTNENRFTISDKPRASSATAWRIRAFAGIFLSALRLLKGTQTFQGGIDYIAWKIKRHSGIDIKVTDWERKHPMLAAPGAALRYYRLRSAKQKRD